MTILSGRTNLSLEVFTFLSRGRAAAILSPSRSLARVAGGPLRPCAAIQAHAQVAEKAKRLQGPDHAGIAAPYTGHSQRASARLDHQQARAGFAAVASAPEWQWQDLRLARIRGGLHLQRQGAGAL